MGKQARNYTQQTIKILFALSASQCSFPNCKKQIVNENNAIDSNICHIQGANLGSERYNPNMSDKERADYNNLILLCPQHHFETNNVNIYTVEVLHKMKKEHEDKINSLVHSSNQNLQDREVLNQFLYFMKEYKIPLLSLEYMVESLPSSINMSFLSFNSFFDNFKRDNRDRYPFNDNQLNNVFNIFVGKYITLIHKIGDDSINNNGQYNNFVHIDNTNQMKMNEQYLSYENINNLNNEIELLKNNFIISYLNLIDFLRNEYPDVNLKN